MLGMSGGVDSSAAALLLRKTGYEVVGVTLPDPIPCVLCNPAIKFGAMLDRAERLRFDCVAAGTGRRLLRRGHGAGRRNNPDERALKRAQTQRLNGRVRNPEKGFRTLLHSAASRQ